MWHADTRTTCFHTFFHNLPLIGETEVGSSPPQVIGWDLLGLREARGGNPLPAAKTRMPLPTWHSPAGRDTHPTGLTGAPWQSGCSGRCLSSQASCSVPRGIPRARCHAAPQLLALAALESSCLHSTLCLLLEGQCTETCLSLWDYFECDSALNLASWPVRMSKHRKLAN